MDLLSTKGHWAFTATVAAAAVYLFIERSCVTLLGERCAAEQRRFVSEIRDKVSHLHVQTQ